MSPKSGRNSEGSLKLPSFLGVGPPRTGTTWLHVTFAEYANLPPLSSKETKFFDRHYDLGLDWYARNFDQSSDLMTGEFCPTYFASSEARERIGQLVRCPRIVCTFRDPVVRLFSLYKKKRAYGDITWDFSEAIERDPELLESGRYVHHLAEWRRIFGKENVLAAFYEDLAADPQSYVDQIADFIGVPRFKLEQRHLRRIHSSDDMGIPRSLAVTRLGSKTAEWLKARHLGNLVKGVKRSKLMRLFVGGTRIPPLPKDEAAKLRLLFKPEVEALERLVQRDLSSWKTAAAA